MILLELFLTFVLIGILNFGGGYAMISFIQNQVVNIHGWLTLREYTDMIAISQATPGPIAVNTATYTGFKIAGVPGALLATLALIVPAYFIILGLMYIFRRWPDNKYLQWGLSGIKPMVLALIIGSAFTLGVENVTNLYELVLFGLAMLLLRKFNTNPIILILAFGCWGIFTANFIF
ncbi:MAG TPA: chromate transporter [Candidatus Avidehalobacter gallistercoris]|uniref:Chromate transporter n=1 Tax=Candidatus Avidehalobacter gallistercoris TaxID=2840694 RepID=A0A9D1HJ26_9FIRM|nr:chromate transporter [Candidatus Avidehalobacter gallistercoris]